MGEVIDLRVSAATVVEMLRALLHEHLRGDIEVDEGPIHAHVMVRVAPGRRQGCRVNRLSRATAAADLERLASTLNRCWPRSEVPHG